MLWFLGIWSAGPLAILAGAGTGKTRVISRRAASATGTGVIPAAKILLVAFTDKGQGAPIPPER